MSNAASKIGKKKQKGRFGYGKLRREMWQQELDKKARELEAEQIKARELADAAALEQAPPGIEFTGSDKVSAINAVIDPGER